jgi:glutamine amidotransferase
MGNLASVRRALEECGAEVVVSADPAALTDAERIVLPGVGAFPDGMAKLEAAGWPAALNRALANPAVKLLGICLGMQLLADRGFEGRETRGLGLIRGEIRRFVPMAGERIPHVGWNEVHPTRAHGLFERIPLGTDFYFVHSYCFQAATPAEVLATTPYCGPFASAVGAGNVVGTQFHPEKSSRPGFQLIRNFLAR